MEFETPVPSSVSPVRKIKVISLNGENGFTMIELLMVIIIVSSLSVSAFPQFLDFRNEGKKAVVQQILSSVRTGLKLQQMNIKLRCNAPRDSRVDFEGLRQNDLTVALAWRVGNTSTTGSCTSAQLPNASDRRVIDTDGPFPANPFTGANGIYVNAGAPGLPCNTVDMVNYGWCYTDGNFWANSNVLSESAI